MSSRRLISSGSSFETLYGYSRAVVDGDWIFVSGTTGFDYAAGTISDCPIEQTRQALRNIEAALAEAGATLADVVRARYILPNAADWESVATTLGSALKDIRPAATAIVADLIDPRMKIEVEVTAKRSSAD